MKSAALGLVAGVALGVGAVIAPAGAAVIFDATDSPQTNGLSTIANSVGAADFVLDADYVLKDVHFYTSETQPSTDPWYATWQASHDIEWFLWQEDATPGPNGAPLHSGVATNVVRTAEAACQTNFFCFTYDFDLDTPVALDGGTTYWLGLYFRSAFVAPSSTSLGVNVTWRESSATPFGSIDYDSANGTNLNVATVAWGTVPATTVKPLRDFAFHLTGDPADVPEPATLALLGLGLVGFAARRRRA